MTSAPVLLGVERSPTHSDDIERIAGGAAVAIDPAALAGMARNHEALIRTLRTGAPVYGLTTGVGDLITAPVGDVSAEERQRALLRSHAAGVGAPLEQPVVRAIMAVLLVSLLRGLSAAHPGLAQTLADLLNAGVTPVAPSGGSVGYLVATAHIGLVAVGEGAAVVGGVSRSGADALAVAGLRPHRPTLRDGHAVISNTAEITAHGILAATRLRRLVAIGDIAGALSTEGLGSSGHGFDAAVQLVRPQPDQAATATRLRALLAGRRPVFGAKLQDPLSIRCIPQVHGAARSQLAALEEALERELASVTDNPVFLPEGDHVRAVHGGNGHGAALALPLDAAAIAVSSVASMSAARSDRLNSAALSGLPAFLTTHPGANSGLMLASYVAAARSGEIRQLAGPASVHSVSTSAGQEDHVSMGVAAAAKLRTGAEYLADVLSVELLCSAQAIDLRGTGGLGTGTRAAHAALRSRVARLQEDRPVHLDLAAVRLLMDTGSLADAVAPALEPDREEPR